MESSIRVAKYVRGAVVPQMSGYKSIVIHIDGKPLGGQLSPYVLRNEKGHLLENIWQFSKVYPEVSRQCVRLSARYPRSRIIWEHGAEKHYDVEHDEVIYEAWSAWRDKGYNNAYAVRYPNGYYGRHKCLFSLWNDERLDYIAARKRIYCGEYARLAPRTEHFKQLKAMLDRGENLLIVEVDGPDPTLTYPPYDTISPQHPGLLIDEATIRLLVNDARHPFGHGYTIAALLLDGAEWMN